MKKISILAVALLLAVVFTAFKKNNAITVFMIGDSTMANKDISGGKLERGWGMMLQGFFTDDVVVDNHAVNGRSSKSFIDEGRWQAVVEKIKPGDYVFIQFGHNDEKPHPSRHTDPGTTFDANLKKFISETREKGGIPVLFNAVVRRNFFLQEQKNDDDEALRNTVGATSKKVKEEGDILYDTHGAYRDAPRNVAKEMGVAFVDANKITHELEQGLGREESKKLHMWFLPGEVESVPEGRQDNTHYNVYGATVVASLLSKEIAVQVPALKKHIRHYDMVVAADGTGMYFTPQDAVEAAPVGKKVRILVSRGMWKKPSVPSGKKVKFIMRSGAEWMK